MLDFSGNLSNILNKNDGAYYRNAAMAGRFLDTLLRHV